MNRTDLKRTIFDKVQSFNTKCEKEHRAITEEREKQRKEEEDREKRNQDLVTKFDETILKDLQNFFSEIEPMFSSRYLEILLDTHHQAKQFFIRDRDSVPAYAFLVLDAKSTETQETFDFARYLLFAVSASGDSFVLQLKNERRDRLYVGESEADDTSFIQSYLFDNYDFDEILGHIEKYLAEELSYLHENFEVTLEEWED